MQANPTLDRIFRREIWATEYLFHQLSCLNGDFLSWTLEGLDRPLSEILGHVVRYYAECLAEITGAAISRPPDPVDEGDLENLASFAVATIAELQALALAGDDRPLSMMLDQGAVGYPNWKFEYPSSVVLAEAVFHADHHRDEIRAILSSRGEDGLSDLRHFGFAHDENPY